MRRLPALLCALISLLASAACGIAQPYSPDATNTPTAVPPPLPVPLPGDQQGFFLVTGGEAILIPPQSLSQVQSLYLQDLPTAGEGQPLVLARLSDLHPAQLHLWQMRGSVGVVISLDKTAGGVRVNAVRPGFGAETGGLQPGDLILSVDGTPLEDFILNAGGEDRFAELLTGELGTQVQLDVQRSGEQLTLHLLRNFPTILSIYRPIDFEQQELSGGVLALAPGGTLPEGMYCYEPSHFNFSCFLVGELDVAQPIPTPVGAAISAGATGTPPAGNIFQSTPCRFMVQPGQDVTCGDLLVPEDRSHPQGETIRLHVAIFHNPYRTQPDPVIYLHGGPGAGALDWMANAYASSFQFLFPQRDLVVFDQRGAGYSRPRLACDFGADYAASLAQDERLSLLEWQASHMPDCLQDLQSQGIDLSAYTTLASAADLHDLILALGYEQVNLFGQSYGTILAITYLQEYSAHGRVRSLVLDGVLPPQADLFAERGINAQGAFQAVFAACAAGPSCDQVFPDLEQRFYRLLERLRAEPVALPAAGAGGQPVVVNDYRLIEALYRTGYFSDQVASIPAMLVGFEQGQYRLFRRTLDDMLASATSVDAGAYAAILCSLHGAQETPEAGAQSLVQPLQDYFRTTEQAMRQLCASLPAVPASIARAYPAVSDTPVLLLSGLFDPATPPAWAALVARHLSRSYHYISPTGSHDLLAVDSCAQVITTRFIQDLSAPDDPCLEQQPAVQFFTGSGN